MESSVSMPLSSSPLTLEALNDVRDRLKGPPLSGRRVLIPLGSKAFVPGALIPEVKPKDPSSNILSHRSEETCKEEECVTVRQVAKSDGTMVPEQFMTRQEALEYLQSEIDQKSRRNNTTSPKGASSPGNQSSSMKASDTKPPSRPVATLPFMEIREEIDASGNETKVETLNVTEQLKMIQRDSSDAVNSDDDSNVSPVPITNDVDENYEPISDESNDIPPPRIVSDEEYAKLSDRLDQLILLEEQAQKPTPQRSKQKLGWSKGFLNATPKPKSSPSRPAISSPNSTNTSKRVEPSTPGPVSHASLPPAKTPSGSSKGVSFHPQDSVQEIPRIGERSVRDITQSRSVGNATTDAFSSPKVIEKSSKRNPYRSTVVTTAASDAALSNSVPASEDAVEPKKLSRFALERLHERQGHYK